MSVLLIKDLYRIKEVETGTRKSSQLRLPIICTITAIYALYVVQSAIAWYRLDTTFKLNSQSTGPLAPFFGPGWYHLLANACFSIQTEIADALMVRNAKFMPADSRIFTIYIIRVDLEVLSCME